MEGDHGSPTVGDSVTKATRMEFSVHTGRARPDGRWHLDEVFVSVNGKQLYVWRAVDSEGEVLYQPSQWLTDDSPIAASDGWSMRVFQAKQQ